MIPYSSSSGQNKRQNADGSINVYCTLCGEFIASTYMRIGSALCVLCQKSTNGETVDADFLRDYKLSKGNRGDVSMLLVPAEPKDTTRKFSLRSMAGDVLTALGIKKEQPVVESQKVSISKRRSRLLGNVTLGGDIAEIDKKLEHKE
jgi:hypothetical protein